MENKIILCPNCQSNKIETTESWKRTGAPKTNAHPLMPGKRISYGYKFSQHCCTECNNTWEGDKIN